jgi:ketosteroid isomerase-like protein
VTAVEDFLQATMPRFVDAELALHSGDVAGRLAMWSALDPVTLFGAAAPSRSGWDQVEPVFRWLASRFAACNTYDLELVAAGASGDLAYTVAHEHYEALTNDGSLVRTTLRATHVYRREGGEWKIVHRHGDHPPVDRTPQPESPDARGS